MKPKGILMKAEMVRATMRPVNPKRQTRRLSGLEEINKAPDKWTFFEQNGDSFTFLNHAQKREVVVHSKYPTGTVLYVKETWGTNSRWDDIKPSLLPVDVLQSIETFFYAANYEGQHVHPSRLDKWRSPLFMQPRMARIWLEVTNVLVERLQDVSEADAIAEGVTLSQEPAQVKALREACGADWKYLPATIAYRNLWESINGLGSWDANPYVFAYTFKRIEKPTTLSELVAH